MGVSVAGIVSMGVVVRMGVRRRSVVQNANIRQSGNSTIAESARPSGGREEKSSSGGQKTA